MKYIADISFDEKRRSSCPAKFTGFHSALTAESCKAYTANPILKNNWPAATRYTFQSRDVHLVVCARKSFRG